MALPAANQMVVENVVTGLVTTTAGNSFTVNDTFYGKFGGNSLAAFIHDDIVVSITDLNAPLTRVDPVIRNAVLFAPTPAAVSSTTGHLKIVFTLWKTDLQSGSGVAGSTVVTDLSGDTATITASAAGFRVVIVKSGVTQAFDVPR